MSLSQVTDDPATDNLHFARSFYPARPHHLAAYPLTYLIVGPHGAGKTTLLKAMQNGLFFSPAIYNTSSFSEIGQRMLWRTGYPSSLDIASLPRFLSRLSDKSDPHRALSQFWEIHLVQSLRNDLNSPELAAIFDPQTNDIEQIMPMLDAKPYLIACAFDALDDRLVREGRWLSISYDALESIGGLDWGMTFGLITGLVHFWVEHMRRWQRIHPKIFLRTDFFNALNIRAADFAKVTASRLELTWNEYDLCAMFIKRMANTSQDWLAYFQGLGLSFAYDAQVGFIPVLDNFNEARYLFEQLLAGFLDGRDKMPSALAATLDALRDGRGDLSPRNFFDLFRYAALQEVSSAQHHSPYFLQPHSLKKAIERLSHHHVHRLKDNEMPWLAKLAEHLTGRKSPLTRQALEDAIAQGWDAWCASPDAAQRPPRATPSQLVDFLIQIGICRIRRDHKIEFPELFIHGLGLKLRKINKHGRKKRGHSKHTHVGHQAVHGMERFS